MSRCYYNGVLLSNIPSEISLEEYPYIWIRKNEDSGYYDLACATNIYYYSSSRLYISAGTQKWYRLPIGTVVDDTTEWVFYKTMSGSDYWGISATQSLLWSCFNIPNGSETSTTLYFPRCEKIAYTDKKLKFNDVELPMLPTEYLSSNPYVFIRKNNTTGNYDLVLGASAWYYGTSNNNICPSGTDVSYWYTIPIANSDTYTEWVFNKSTNGNFGLDADRTLLWSLQDIPNGQNSITVYFTATAPIIDLTITKYLIRDNSTIYTITDGALIELTGTLNAQLFKDSGVDTIPDGTLLMTLSNPEVLCWKDSDTVPTLSATVQGIPQPQVIVSEEINLMDGSIKGIESVAIDCKGEPVFAVSFDKKATWIMYDGTDWVEVADNVTGMTKAVFEAITLEQWQTKYEASSEMYIRCTLLDETQSLTSITLNFIN